MKTILDWRGNTQYLSDEVYELQEDIDSEYRKGVLVRLISGVDGSRTVGHHFNPQYVTVCRVDAPQAQFVGTKREYLRKTE